MESLLFVVDESWGKRQGIYENNIFKWHNIVNTWKTFPLDHLIAWKFFRLLN
jgi:hypothetical protein